MTQDHHSHQCCSNHQERSDKTIKLASTKAVEYTCPMHPEVISQIPGICPKCGMALELKAISLDEGHNPELEDMQKRFWGAAILSAFVLLLSMGPMVKEDIFNNLSPFFLRWSEFVLSTPVVIWAGWPFFQRAVISLQNKSLNMFTLLALGIGTAYIYSCVALFWPHLFPSTTIVHAHVVALYFESASLITALALLGQVLELKARNQTNQALKSLLKLMPDTARFVRKDGHEENVAIQNIQVGAVLRVRPGEKIPLDGIVLEGTSLVDESMITGEPIPIEKITSSKVIAGTLNGTGSFLMRVEKEQGETLLAKIVQLVSDAQRTKAPIQKLADLISSYFVPLVILAAIVTFVVWFIFGPEPRLNHAIINAVAVLIIACPCALGLATPMSIMVGAALGAQRGILIKNAESIEALEKVDTLIVDKTGTLTLGKPQVTSIFTNNAFKEDELLRYAASLEIASEHPLAEAIVMKAQEKGLELFKVKDFQSISGKGARGHIKGHEVMVGSKSFLDEHDVDTSSFINKTEKLRKEAQTVIFIAIDGEVKGIIGIADPIKESSKEAINHLKDLGIKIYMVTGDHETTAKAVANKLGIENVKAGALPADKLEIMKSLQASGSKVAMAGDGINDAPALAQADVGIAMGNGTDAAIHSAGITLIKGDLRGIVQARHLSVSIVQNIKQNLFLAFIYNTLGVPIAAGVLYPFFGVLLNPIFAAAAMSLSSVSVIWNALRLRNLKF